MKTCCRYDMEFTGKTIPAQPGTVMVLVELLEDGTPRLSKEYVQAWGQFAEILLVGGIQDTTCPVCGAEDEFYDKRRGFAIRPSRMFALSPSESGCLERSGYGPEDDLGPSTGIVYVGPDLGDVKTTEVVLKARIAATVKAIKVEQAYKAKKAATAS